MNEPISTIDFGVNLNPLTGEVDAVVANDTLTISSINATTTISTNLPI